MAKKKKNKKALPKKKAANSSAPTNSMSLQRNTKELNVYLSRKNNVPPPDHVIVTPEEKTFWKEKIFTNENFNLVKRASKTRKSKQNGISQRVQVIQDIVTNNIGSKVNVFRFDDDTDKQIQLEYDQVLKYSKDRFTKLLSEDKKKNE